MPMVSCTGFVSDYTMDRIKADTAIVDHKKMARRIRVLKYLAFRANRWQFA